MAWGSLTRPPGHIPQPADPPTQSRDAFARCRNPVLSVYTCQLDWGHLDYLRDPVSEYPAVATSRVTSSCNCWARQTAGSTRFTHSSSFLHRSLENSKATEIGEHSNNRNEVLFHLASYKRASFAVVRAPTALCNNKYTATRTPLSPRNYDHEKSINPRQEYLVVKFLPGLQYLEF